MIVYYLLFVCLLGCFATIFVLLFFFFFFGGGGRVGLGLGLRFSLLDFIVSSNCPIVVYRGTSGS